LRGEEEQIPLFLTLLSFQDQDNAMNDKFFIFIQSKLCTNENATIPKNAIVGKILQSFRSFSRS
jgi:hypothetical protein